MKIAISSDILGYLPKYLIFRFSGFLSDISRHYISIKNKLAIFFHFGFSSIYIIKVLYQKAGQFEYPKLREGEPKSTAYNFSVNFTLVGTDSVESKF